jgi:hypothetical protein
MIKGNHKEKILKDHKKVGKKFIPPFMQLSNLVETSFRDNTLPCLVWVASMFLRNSDRATVNCIIEFLVECKEILDDKKSPPLIFLNNFDRLNIEQKNKILRNLKNRNHLKLLRENLYHQNFLFNKYPLSFIFAGYQYDIKKNIALEMLKEDVSSLLDRYTLHSTKVQTTAFVSMTATGKLFISSEIEMPDFNSIFTDPESDEGKKVASFVRANITAGAAFQDREGVKNNWSESFWEQAFKLENCS